MGCEEANYKLVKKLYDLDINLNLISDLTEIPIDTVACLVMEKDLSDVSLK